MCPTDASEGNARNHCLYLLIGLLAVILSTPLAGRTEAVGRILLTGFVVVVLLAGVLAVRANRRTLIIALVLGVPATVAAGLRALMPDLFPGVVSLVVSMAFFGFTTIAVLRYVVCRGSVTADRLFGAACVYLLIGLTWSMVYAVIGRFMPGAFLAGGEPMDSTVIVWADLLYFSFATLTTLGYGDITPVLPLVRILAVLEAAVGVLYVAVLVARLVAMYAPASPKDIPSGQ